MTMMRAKVRISHIDKANLPNSETLYMHAVAAKSYPADGSDENNSYAKWSPSGHFQLQVANPALHGKFNVNDEYYVDFTLATAAPVEAAAA